MSDVKARVTTSSGQLIGYFVDFKVVNLCENDYEVSGTFIDESGRNYDRIEFNPQILPYTIDLSQSNHAVKVLSRGYVQRGRQPVVMTFTKV